MELFSNAWAHELAQRVREDERAQRGLRGLDADFQYVVRPVPARGVTEQYAFGMHMGDCSAVWEGVRAKSPFALTLGYDVFHDVVAGRADAFRVIRSRDVSLKGSLTRLLRHGRGVARVLQIARGIPATGAGDFENIPGGAAPQRSGS